MTRNLLARRLCSAALATAAALALTGLLSTPAAADSLPAAGCVTSCVATFDSPSAAETLAIPSGITSLTATISGGAGAEAPAFAVDLVGGAASRGGVTTVDLGTTYAGQTLTLGVGDTGEGSYLQAGSTLLVVAGGGGGAGYGGRLDLPDQISSTQAGGDGGSPSAPGITPGADADVFDQPSVNGGGGTTVGGTAGAGSGAIAANGVAGGGTTTTTGAGSTLAAGGAGPTASIGGNTQVAGSGGSGYTGGGSGGMATFIDSDDNPTDVVGGGGGGAGYLATGLTGTPGDPNTGTGSVVLTWSFTPTISTTATTVHRGDTVPVTITGLPASTAFTVTFDGTTVVTDTSDSSGDATESFVVGSGQPTGHFPLVLVVAGDAVATSDPVAVIGTLATTGGPNPLLPMSLALVLLLAGGVLMTLRRRKAVAE